MMSYPRVLAAVDVAILSTPLATGQETNTQLARDYHFKPVTFSHVDVQDRLWKRRMETSRTVTIPYAFQQCEETGRIGNWRSIAH